MTATLYASELRRVRESLGMTREQLAQLMNYSVSLVEQVETDRKPPSKPFTERADETLKTDGLLERIRVHSLRQGAVPEWFRSWHDIEQQATSLRAYNPLVVYGLVQTEEYARTLLRADDSEHTENRVAARMDRQQVLDLEKPPVIVVLLDEAVLRRQVGTPDVMYRQLLHLTTARAYVQIVPLDAQTYVGLDGPFEVAGYDGREVAYIDAPARGFVLDGAEVVSKLKDRWEALRAEALPQRQSRELILEVAELWKIT